MSDRTCTLCGISFNKPAHLLRHKQRKTPCAPVVSLKNDTNKPHKCDQCGRHYSTTRSLQRHQREVCKSADGQMMVPAHQIHDLQQQIIEMRAMLEMMSMKMAAPIQQNIGQQVVGGHQIHNGTAIHINVFGQENVGHIGKREIRAILDEAQLTKDTSQAATQAMIKAAMLIYSDPDHPENLTCYMPNKKRDEALVYVHRETGPAWELQSCAIVGPPMTARALDTLCANQPFDDADNYAGLMRALIDNEAAYKEGREMRTILVRNKQLLERALGGGLPSQ